MPRRAPALLLALALAVGLVLGSSAGASMADSPSTDDSGNRQWSWPIWPFRLVGPYEQPAHRYAAGHRGIDLLPLGGADVRAPAAGVVAFVGRVVDRDLVTIDHGDGFVTTFEPVVSTLVPGSTVERGDVVGVISSGGHAAQGALHFGVRLSGEYVNPLVLYGGVPRAVLLPCCD
jgi:murein DD-endopeptidase MepM/ murein hydrolase activator NlpD